jgi:hypothetical protein
MESKVFFSLLRCLDSVNSFTKIAFVSTDSLNTSHLLPCDFSPHFCLCLEFWQSLISSRVEFIRANKGLHYSSGSWHWTLIENNCREKFSFDSIWWKCSSSERHLERIRWWERLHAGSSVAAPCCPGCGGNILLADNSTITYGCLL